MGLGPLPARREGPGAGRYLFYLSRGKACPGMQDAPGLPGALTQTTLPAPTVVRGPATPRPERVSAADLVSASYTPRVPPTGFLISTVLPLTIMVTRTAHTVAPLHRGLVQPNPSKTFEKSKNFPQDARTPGRG